MSETVRVVAVCVSEKKGTQKSRIPMVNVLEDWGIEGDAHAGKWHRQVSLLPYEKIQAFRLKGADVDFGAFGENIVISGTDPALLAVGTRFKIGADVILELTQIGKECHSHCAIYKKMGDCIMPREGVFTRVIRGGIIREGDDIQIIPPDPMRPFTAARITLSDKGSRGEREDTSGPCIDESLRKDGYLLIENMILPDGLEPLCTQLVRLTDQRQIDLVITTGGTGLSERDVTPEATESVCQRMVPGIPEAIRAYSLTKTCNGMLSRGVAGIRGKTLIINLPGSERAVKESMEVIMPALKHGLGIIRGTTGECGKK